MGLKSILGKVAKLAAGEVVGKLPGGNLLFNMLTKGDGDTMSKVAKSIGVVVANPENILKKLESDPNAAKKAQDALLTSENIAEMRRIDLERDQAYLADGQDARHAFSTDGDIHWMQAVIAIITLVAFFGFLFAVIYIKATGGDLEENVYLGILVGVLPSKVSTIYNYFFGASKK